MNTVVLFGAGVYAKKYKALLEYLDIEFDYFTDNDERKWGTQLYGKPVIPPEQLSRMDCNVIISCTHEDSVREQLCQRKLAQRIIGLDELYNRCKQKMSEKEPSDPFVIQDAALLVDMYEGIGWGGTEMWAADLALGLYQRKKRVFLLGDCEQPSLEKEYEELAVRFEESGIISSMVDFMEKHLPCVLVNNFAGCAFMAAVIVKLRNPGKMKIISVIHNDNKNLFDAHMMMKEYIDSVFCVSSRIKDRITEEYYFDAGRVFYRPQPITVKEERKSLKSAEHGAVRIGYAARLVKQQKRADLLPAFIAGLEKRKINYILQIAGEGECGEEIISYIESCCLHEKVQMLGRLPKSQMNDFWEAQDIFINLSEFEGCSLSMLEAMGCGCVPIVTDVSGSREFIVNNQNGFICKVGDLEGMADCVSAISADRIKLDEFARICHESIVQKCNPDSYVDYWIKEVL